jgi:hypothetical protein
MSDLKIVAVVSMNGGEGFVMNRPLRMLYEKAGKDFVGTDGPFVDRLYYSHGSGRFVAFAGREITLQMKDGSTEKIKDHWWHGVSKGLVSVPVSSEQELSSCYVFSGLTADPSSLALLRSEYTGEVYPYWDYEKKIRNTKEGRSNG